MGKGLCWTVLWLAPLFLTEAAMAQVPALHYSPPANTFKQGLATPEDYAFTTCNASVQVYPFRPFRGDIGQLFRRTLLRDWISPLHQEQNLAGAPSFMAHAVPGATQAFSAGFAENIVGLPRPHLRIVIVVNNQAAIIDASAGTMQSWQVAWPSLTALVGGLRVEAGRALPSLTTANSRRVAGLYQGIKAKYMATMINVTGSSYYTQALHYYLFSPDGRVYRAYDRLPVPGGDPARFDFDAAKARDPGNSGTYAVDGGNLVIHLGGSEPLVAGLPKDGTLTISGVLYKRQ